MNFVKMLACCVLNNTCIGARGTGATRLFLFVSSSPNIFNFVNTCRCKINCLPSTGVHHRNLISVPCVEDKPLPSSSHSPIHAALFNACSVNNKALDLISEMFFDFLVLTETWHKGDGLLFNLDHPSWIWNFKPPEVIWQRWWHYCGLQLAVQHQCCDHSSIFNI